MNKDNKTHIPASKKNIFHLYKLYNRRNFRKLWAILCNNRRNEIFLADKTTL